MLPQPPRGENVTALQLLNYVTQLQTALAVEKRDLNQRLVKLGEEMMEMGKARIALADAQLKGFRRIF